MATDTGLTFGELLRRARQAAGLTQEVLAERAGLSVRGIADLERGARRAPYPDTVRRLAEALHLAAPDRAPWMPQGAGWARRWAADGLPTCSRRSPCR